MSAGPDGTAERAPTRGEREKAARQGRVPARAELARAVRRAAVAATDVASFVEVLRGEGVVVRVRVGPSGDPLGYAVGRVGDVTGGGEQVVYSGSKLAADLSLPRLRRRWAGVSGGPAESGEALVAARFAADRARRRFGSAPEAVAADLAAAAGDLVVACSGWRVGGAGLDGAAAAFDRATRPARGLGVRASGESVALRRVARRVQRRGPLMDGDGDEVAAAVALALALAALMREVMAWQQRRGRVH